MLAFCARHYTGDVLATTDKVLTHTTLLQVACMLSEYITASRYVTGNAQLTSSFVFCSVTSSVLGVRNDSWMFLSILSAGLIGTVSSAAQADLMVLADLDRDRGTSVQHAWLLH